MKKLTARSRKILSRIFRVISVSAASLILPACYAAYGMPPSDVSIIRGNVVSKGTREPIPGIKVFIEETEVGDYTGERGDFYFNVETIQDSYKLKVEDIDGPANGGTFKERTLTLMKEHYPLSIEMELDTETNEE